jgi:hypothetical protein
VILINNTVISSHDQQCSTVSLRLPCDFHYAILVVQP